MDTKNIDSYENLIRDYLINKGFNEVINDPFVEKKSSESIKGLVINMFISF